MFYCLYCLHFSNNKQKQPLCTQICFWYIPTWMRSLKSSQEKMSLLNKVKKAFVNKYVVNFKKKLNSIISYDS